MKIYIEVLLIFFLMIIFIIWYLWNWWTTKRLLKKYDPEKDLAKLGEEKRLKEIEIHNGKKIENQKVGRERIRGFPGTESSTNRIQRGSSTLNKESFVPSRRSELSSDNSVADIKRAILGNDKADKKNRRSVGRGRLRRRFRRS